MYEYISGEIKDISPTFAVIEAAGVGYFVKISLITFQKIDSKKEAKLFIHHVLREDTSDFYGFVEKSEREIFRLLISVSGIGANTARLMLSSLATREIVEAIIEGDVNKIKSVKGIGLKTAQRVIVDLKDKVGKIGDSDSMPFAESKTDILVEEALSALTMLGFNKKQIEKKLQNILKKEKDLSVEELVKLGIKSMSS
ncbi:MAG: Holliday junction branch migration protein RuvA [Bacteroidota bacterium]|nr:Holliday junction branch migration protein RuvA [Bacteroidota bacterium]